LTTGEEKFPGLMAVRALKLKVSPREKARERRERDERRDDEKVGKADDVRDGEKEVKRDGERGKERGCEEEKLCRRKKRGHKSF
jgi:hypothetical protein